MTKSFHIVCSEYKEAVTKCTGGATKHQRQHHAQCCNGHQTHSMQHGAQSVVWIHLSHEISRPLFIDTNSTLLLPTFQSPLYVDFSLLRRTSSYFRDLTLIVTRVTLTSIRHLRHLLIVTLPRTPYAHSAYVMSQQLLSKSDAT